MNSVGLQNSNENLELLAAMRQIYSDAKKMIIIQFVFSIVISVIIALVTLFVKEFEIFAEIYGVLMLFIDSMFFNRIISERKVQAACIQEEFDCKVLSLKKNEIKENCIDQEDIIKWAKKYKMKKENLDELREWYTPTQLQQIPIEVARICCQRENCSWDLRLRKKYNALIYTVTIIAITIVFIAFMLRGITLKAFFLNGILPTLPIFSFLYSNHTDNKQSIQTREKLKNLCNDYINNIGENRITEIARQIQDGIYEDRCGAPLILDCFYNMFKSEQQDEESEVNRQLIQQYINNQNT